jgi:Recombination endonuclease VII
MTEKRRVAQRVAGKKYYATHRESILEQRAALHKANPEKRRARARADYVANPALMIARSKGFKGEEAKVAAQVINALPEYCESCGSTENLDVDHDHKLMVINGRLCHGCNVARGYLHNDPKRMRNLANYEERIRNGQPGNTRSA